MNTRRFAVTTILGLALALASAVLMSKPAAAKCYDQQKQPIPCPKTDYQVKQPTATDAPKATDTPTPQLLSQQGIVVTPDAAQLAILCANLPGGSTSSAGGSGNPSPNTPPAPPQPGLSPFLLGGGGLLGGILIGLLLPAVSRGFSWGRNVNGDGRGMDDWEQKHDKWSKADKWQKGEDAGFLKLAPPPPGYTGDGNQPMEGFTVKLDKSDAALNYSKQGEAANYAKQGEAGFEDLGLRGAGKVTKPGGEAGFTDELRGGNTFNKADDAGFTDEL